MANRTFPDLNFNHVADPANYFKAFCLNPANDHCDLGVCPNTDVTGIGQQVSIYITTFIYGASLALSHRNSSRTSPPLAIVFAYVPRLHRTMLYAHLSVLYSLFIAALVSLLKGELTNADGIFVLVTAASPSSLHLWYLTIRSFWNISAFPIQRADNSAPVCKSLEVQFTRILALLSLIFEITLICLIFIPTNRIRFSQPACSREYGKGLWYNVVWVLPVAIQSIAILVLFFLALRATRWWTSRRAYEVPAPMPQPLWPGIGGRQTTEQKDNIDIISWTEQVLFESFPYFMNRTLFICIITTIQLSALPTFQHAIDSKDCLSMLFILAGLFREKPRRGSYVVKTYVIRVL
ncbi:hypothetical protein EST38_g3215 [Candolleomyces aberdarensis]|uniref:Uncharacterized protein n=1 Tax=Candolleomyces aberdarensis TaxID=2316362 RepID=A0A4Q2DR27_9AGAR|nr:hypothetical protein EST38_g3215 [Candolleomyces aberdarensis]